MSDHSPLPWRIQDAESSNYTIEIVATNRRGNEELVCRPSGRSVRDANAALIVRAVNAHAQLVAALEQVLQDDREFRCCSSVTLKAIEAALASLKDSA